MLPCHTLSSRHGPSSTCSHLLVLRFHGPAARILGTQVHDIFHTARATCTFNSGERGCNIFSPGPAVKGVIGNFDSGQIGSMLLVFIRCPHSLDIRVLLLVLAEPQSICALQELQDALCSEFSPTCCGDLCGGVFVYYYIHYKFHPVTGDYMDLFNQGL